MQFRYQCQPQCSCPFQVRFLFHSRSWRAAETSFDSGHGVMLAGNARGRWVDRWFIMNNLQRWMAENVRKRCGSHDTSTEPGPIRGVRS